MFKNTIAVGLALHTALLVAPVWAAATRSDPQQVDAACGSQTGYSIGERVRFEAATRLGVDGPMALASFVGSDGAVVVVTTSRYRTPGAVAQAVADLERVARVESVGERCGGCAAQGAERRLVLGPGGCGRAGGYRIIRAVGVAVTVIAAQDLSHALDVECLVYERPPSHQRPAN